MNKIQDYITELFNREKTHCIEPTPSWLKIADTQHKPSDEFLEQLSQHGQSSYLSHVVSKHIILDDATIFFSKSEIIPLTEKSVKECKSLTISYYPDYERLVFHQVEVIREGERIDNLKCLHMYTSDHERLIGEEHRVGLKMITVFPRDINPGDTLVISYSKYNIRPEHTLGNCLSRRFGDFDEYDGEKEISYIAPIHKEAHYYTNDDRITYEKTIFDQENGLQEQKWKIPSLAPFPFEDGAPMYANILPELIVSEYNTWNEIARALAPHYTPKVEDFQITSLAESIWLPEDSTEQKIRKALEFVQKEVEYTIFDEGVNALKPQDLPRTIISRRGDCKDKTLLFIALLKLINVTAHPALVDSTNKDMTDIPNLDAFDHVICVFNFNQRQYWVDLTNDRDTGSLENREQLFFKQVLVISPDTQNLVAIEPTADETYYETHTFDFKKYAEEKLDYIPLEIVTVSRGRRAISQRQYISEEGLKTLENRFLAYLQNTHYPSAQVVRDLEIIDNNDKNEITTIERYGIYDEKDLLKENGDYLFSAAGETIRNLRYPEIEKRQYPFNLNSPINWHIKTIVKTNNHFKELNTLALNIENEHYAFKASILDKDNTIALHHHIQVFADDIAPSAILQYCEDYERLRDNEALCLPRFYLYDYEVENSQKSSPWRDFLIGLLIIYVIMRTIDFFKG